MIQKRGNRYRVVVYAGVDPFTGKRRQFSGSAATELDARQLEIDLERRAAFGQSEANPTLDDVVREWWASGPRLAATTVVNYRHKLENHILPGGPNEISILPMRIPLVM